LGNPLTRPDQAFTLPQLANDLLRRVPAPRTHLLIRPPAPSWGIGLSPQLDPFTGIQSITIKLYGARREHLPGNRPGRCRTGPAPGPVPCPAQPGRRAG